MGEESGRGVWERSMGEESGREIWERSMGEESGREIWEMNMGEESERGVWEESGCPGATQEAPEGTREAPEGTQEAPRRHHGHPGGTQGTQEARLGSELKVRQNICVFSAKVVRPGIWLEV